MCKGCWVEDGSPSTLPDGWAEIVALIKALYEREPGGGPLHPLLDDYALEAVQPGGEGDYDERAWALAREIGARLEPLGLEERAAVVAKWAGWLDPPRRPEACTFFHPLPGEAAGEPVPVTRLVTEVGGDGRWWACERHAEMIRAYQSKYGVRVAITAL